MRAAAVGWSLVYYACSAVAVAAVVAVAAQAVVVRLGRPVAEDVVWVVGAAAGFALGLWLARRTRASRGTHRALRVLGGVVVLAGLVGAAVMAWLANERRDPEVFFGGFEEFLLSLLGLLLAGFGTCVWLAGISGSRLERTRGAAEGAPLG